MRADAYSTHDDAKSRVLQATDIVALIGQSVALKRRGKDFVGLCPFHQERTPSFSVSPSKQRFYCYGCEKGGNAIDFVMLRDRVEFKDALRMLAEAAGIELPAFKQSRESVSERQILLEALSAASMFFEKSLSHAQHGQAARKYLDERGFNSDSIQKFHIGLATDSWDALLRSAAMKKFTPQQLALAGLVKPRERGEGYYDTFRNRLVFPIRDENGRTIAFGGRVMPGSEDPAKYLNSPETPLFSKSRCVFGLDLARTRIVETRTAAIVEGYTDVAMAHQFGVANVVSVLGTALTEQHLTLLRRFADRIVLLFDGDRAGANAVNRAVELYLTQPVEIAIVTLPKDTDPDEFLLANGAEAFEAILAEAPDALTFKWKQLDREFKASEILTGKQKAVQQYLELLSAARGSSSVDAIRWGAALLQVSKLTGIMVEDLNRRFKIRPAKKAPAKAVQVTQAAEPNISAPAGPKMGHQRDEGFILGLLLSEGARWHDVQQHLHPTDFTDETLRRIAELLWQYQQDEGVPVLDEFLAVIQDPVLKGVAVKWVEEVSAAVDAEAVLEMSLAHLSARRHREELDKLVSELRRNRERAAEEPGDLSADIDTLRKLQEKARRPDLKRVSL